MILYSPNKNSLIQLSHAETEYQTQQECEI